MLALASLSHAYELVDHTHSKYDDHKLDESQLRALHIKMDGNKDGTVDVDEVLAHFKQVHHAVAGNNGHGHLSFHDTDDDKHLTLEEHLPKRANETWIGELGNSLETAMETRDENHDGKLSWQEFFQFDEAEAGDVDAMSQSNFDKLDKNSDGFVTPEELAAQTIALETEKFRAADKDGNGFLDHSELVGLIHPGTDDAVLTVVAKFELREMDSNLDKKLTRKEFFQLGETEEMIDDDETMVWKKLDANSDGFIDESEMKFVVSGEFHAKDAFKEALDMSDSDKDGKVTADELGVAATQLSESYAMNFFAHWHEHHEL